MRSPILKFAFSAAVFINNASLSAAEIIFIEPNTRQPLPVNPVYLDEKGRATVAFYAQCDQHLAPFIKPHHIDQDIEDKALKYEEEIKRALFIPLQKYKPEEQSNIIKSIGIAIASGRYDLNKLLLLINQDTQNKGNFLDILHAIANTPESTDREILKKILAHEESHYTTKQRRDEFNAELIKVYKECRAEITPAP